MKKLARIKCDFVSSDRFPFCQKFAWKFRPEPKKCFVRRAISECTHKKNFFFFLTVGMTTEWIGENSSATEHDSTDCLVGKFDRLSAKIVNNLVIVSQNWLYNSFALMIINKHQSLQNVWKRRTKQSEKISWAHKLKKGIIALCTVVQLIEKDRLFATKNNLHRTSEFYLPVAAIICKIFLECRYTKSARTIRIYKYYILPWSPKM